MKTKLLIGSVNVRGKEILEATDKCGGLVFEPKLKTKYGVIITWDVWETSESNSDGAGYGYELAGAYNGD